MQKSEWLARVGMLMALSACGDDDGGDAATPSSAAATCSKGCARANAARCPNQPANCQQLCESQISTTPAGCISYVNAYADCVNTAVFSCDSTGAAEARTCAPQLASWQACAGGNVNPTPDAGAPDSRVPPVPDASVIADAASVIADAATVDSGAPDTGTDAGALSCPIEPADGSCETCIKTACCPEVLQCNAECVALSDCGSLCASDDVECGAACNQQHPSGVVGLSALLTCADGACARACANDPVTTNAIKLR